MSETIIVALIGVVAATIGGNGLWEYLRSRHSKKKPMEIMVLAIGRDRLNFLCRHYTKSGYIPEEEYEAFVGMYEGYVSMGGNSAVKRRAEEVLNKLPKQ